LNSQDFDIHTRNRQSALAVNLGLVANIILAIAKVSIGILAHSPALLADGVNSTSDVGYYLVVAIFMRLAGKPPDEMHPYGHNQLESIASLVVGAFIVSTGVAIFWESINNVYDLAIGVSKFQGAEIIALWIALLTVVIKLFLTFFTVRIGNSIQNPAVLALAYDHRNDVFSASGAAVGIALGRMGLPWIDPLVGALVALLVLRTGVGILRQSSTELMDPVPSRALAEQITRLLKQVPAVLRVEEIHAHRFGPYMVINITIGVDGNITVIEGDHIACQVEDLIGAEINLVRRVYVHYHPLRQPDLADTPPDLHCRLDVVE
jgi:cation diffusion facilitator family transporter